MFTEVEFLGWRAVSGIKLYQIASSKKELEFIFTPEVYANAILPKSLLALDAVTFKLY